MRMQAEGTGKPMKPNLLALAAAAAGALTVGMAIATPASALTLLDTSCDVYSAAGCKFALAHNEFDDPQAYMDAWNGIHAATPAPAELDLVFLGKKEAGVDFANELKSVSFTNLPYDVSFYAVKAGSTYVQLFGVNPAADGFTASNTGIYNKKGNALLGISHVTFFGRENGGIHAIPEPATWAMMILGFGAAGALVRRRRALAAA